MRRDFGIIVGIAATAFACTPKEPPKPPHDPRAVIAAETAGDPAVGALRPTIVLVPRPPFEPANYDPDFHDELRWPLTAMNHPSLEPRFAIAQAFAQPGVGWIDLCGLGAQNRHGQDKELLSYLRGWCNAIKGDVDAACTHLVPLVGATTRGIHDAVKLDLANILADQGHADKAEHWINRHRIRDVEVLDLLAASYVEVGTPKDAATINRLAMDSDDKATVATRCARMTRQIVLVGNPNTVMIESMRQIANPLGAMPDPTCQRLVHKLECWRATGTNACDPYWADVSIDRQAATLIAAYRDWPNAQTPDDWRKIADATMGIPRFGGAVGYALAAIENAMRTAQYCSVSSYMFLHHNEVTIREALQNAPDLQAQFQRLQAMCRQPAESR